MVTAAPTPDAPTTKHGHIAAELRRRIVEGELAPGDRLPSEAELTDQFGVGRSTIREALRTLTSQHLVVTTRGVTGGTFVTVPGTSQVSALLEANLDLLAGTDGIGVAELLETRELLEVPAARLAAHRRTPEDLEAFRTWLVAPDLVDAEERFRANREFHRAVVAASGNALLEVVCRPIFGVLRSRFPRDDAHRDFWTEVDADHRRIADAIAGRDGAAAAAAMADHLARLRGTYDDLDAARAVVPSSTSTTPSTPPSTPGSHP